ncbi:MAG TPA: AraC family transcriptional regulator [Thermoanaerobaculia bacterium]
MRARPLQCAPGVSVFETAHESDYVALTIEEEVSQNFGVAFVESGEFGVRIEDRQWQLRAGDALVSVPGLLHAYRHDERPADTCISVIFHGAFASEIERRGDFAAAKVPFVPRTTRTAFLRWRLDSVQDAMELQEWSGDLIDAISEPRSAGREARSIEWYAKRIELTRRMMRSQFWEEHTLASLADAAGMSPFHFARLFRDLVGTPPHRYLRNIRLERADSILRDGASVTSTCYDVGFSNLSHFIRSFRVRFGCSPSERRKKVQVKRASIAR